ncbi:MAG: hypothetical protein ACLQPD_08215 [Desulfomonilaceae bacterium]
MTLIVKHKAEESIRHPDQSFGTKSKDAKRTVCGDEKNYSFEVLEVALDGHRFTHGE